VLGTSHYVPIHSIHGLKGGPFFGKERVLRHGLHVTFPGFKGPIVQRVLMLEAGKGSTGTTGFPQCHRGNVGSRVPAY